MPNFTAPNTAAVAIVGADLLSGQVWARTPNDRVLNGLAYTGSAVIGDTEIEVYIDEVRVGSFFNSALLTPQVDRDVQPLESLGIPAGAQLRAVVIDAAATSLVYLMMALEDV